MKGLDKLTDLLGLEFDENGNYIIRILDEEDHQIIADNLSIGVINELLEHQIKQQNYEGAEALKKVLKIKKDE